MDAVSWPRRAVCGGAAPPRCAPASPSSRLLASDPAALATPPTPFFSNLLTPIQVNAPPPAIVRTGRGHGLRQDDVEPAVSVQIRQPEALARFIDRALVRL